MKGWRKSPETLAVIIALALFVSLLPGLSGCSLDDGTFSRVLETIQSGGTVALSDDAEQQAKRFDTVVAQYSENYDARQLKHFRDVFRRVRHNYVNQLDDAVLINAAITGIEEFEFDDEQGSLESRNVVEAGLDAMVASLDPHSSYMNQSELEDSRVSTSGQFGGLGISITLEDDTIKVVSPIEDTPAERAGIKSGDLITHVDGQEIRGMGLRIAVDLMRGSPGTEVVITIERGEQKPFDVTLERAIIRVRAVRWHMEGDIGYVRVTQFSELVEPGIIDAMTDIHRQIGDKLSGIVLDLRSNPGGLLDQSIILADVFLESGKIVSIRGRKKSQDRTHSASPGDMTFGLPIVVLINGGSASASEIVAGALQGHGRAVVMGTRSFGKGSVQTITPLPVEGALRLTTSLYYSPSGQVIQARGILPDIVLKGQQDVDSNDIKHEADLPHSLSGAKSVMTNDAPVVLTETCAVAPSMLNDNDDQGNASKDSEIEIDRDLACALMFLHSGSTSAFLSSVIVQPNS